MEINQKHRILFLDCDGVVNSAKYLNKLDRVKDLYIVDPDAAKLISDLVCSDERIKVVLSSSWRSHHEALRVLTNASIPIFDLCPEPIMGSRYMKGEVISYWLAHNEDRVESYAIIDDNNDMLMQQQKRLVQTSFALGVQPQHIERIRRILECPLNSPVIT